MNKYEFYHNELVEMTIDRNDKMLVEHYAWMSECAKFRDAIDYMDVVIDKDFSFEMSRDKTIPLEVWKEVIHERNPKLRAELVDELKDSIEDAFDISTAVLSEEYSIKARHRKHRKSRRDAKVSRRKNSRWVYYLDGTAKECKTKNHRAVRHEYDIPMGKSNFSHKIGNREYFW